MLCALIDAYEEHYAEELKRLRLQRYRDLTFNLDHSSGAAQNAGIRFD